jgi:hypothetical protein
MRAPALNLEYSIPLTHVSMTLRGKCFWETSTFRIQLSKCVCVYIYIYTYTHFHPSSLKETSELLDTKAGKVTSGERDQWPSGERYN